MSMNAAYLTHFALQSAPFPNWPRSACSFTGGGRTELLARLQDLALPASLIPEGATALDQAPRAVLLLGDTGSGRTTLCRAAEQAVGRWVNLSGRADDDDSLLLELADALESLPAPVVATTNNATTNNAITDDAENATDSPDWARVQAAFSAPCGRGVVLAIDDAERLPRELLSIWLARVAAWLHSGCLLRAFVLVADSAAAARLRDALQQAGIVHRDWYLSALSEQNVSRYVHDCWQAAGGDKMPFTPLALRSLWQLSAGLPGRMHPLLNRALGLAWENGVYEVDAGYMTPPAAEASTADKVKTLLFAVLLGVLLIVLLNAVFSMRRQPQVVSVPQSAPIVLPPTSAPPPPQSDVVFFPLTLRHMAQFDQWYAKVSRKHYFLQLLTVGAGSVGEIEGFVAQARRHLNPKLLRVYRTHYGGRDRIGVIYGDYPNRQAALEALMDLPYEVSDAQPFPRQVSRLKVNNE